MAKDTWFGIRLSQAGSDPFPPMKSIATKSAAEELRRLAADAKKDGKNVDSGILRHGVRILEDVAAAEEDADKSEESRLLLAMARGLGTTDVPAESFDDPEPVAPQRDLSSMTSEEISALSEDEFLALVKKAKKS